MPDGRQGTLHLFRYRGIDVFLHWTWFLVAAYEIRSPITQYSSIVWNILEYVLLFAIVTVHEFGHALACRQVGGVANRIVLWPLGGIAFVNPPPRAGAQLWSIAAGPLVNVVLFVLLSAMVVGGGVIGWSTVPLDLHLLLRAVWYINLGLLVFNMLPIYPLDGGQILRSLLWFIVGPIRSLKAAAVIGFLGAGGLILFAIWARSIWFGVISLFILMNCWSGLQQARILSRMAAASPHPGLVPPPQYPEANEPRV